MKKKTMLKETYCVPEVQIFLALPNCPLATSVDGDQTEDVTFNDWTI